MKSQKGLLFTLIACVIISSVVFMNEKPLWKTFNTNITSKNQTLEEKPEYQVTGFKSKQFSETGKLSSTLNANSLSFFKEQKLSELKQPLIKIFASGNKKNSIDSNWLVKANFANSIAPNRIVNLKDNVEMLQLDTESQIEVYSQELDLNLDTKIAKSAKKVTIISGKNKINGHDFESHLDTAYFELNANVESEHQDQVNAVNNSNNPIKNAPLTTRLLTISSKKFSLENQGNKATYTQNVELKQDSIKINADKIEIIKQGDSQIAFAYGNPARFEQQSLLNNKYIKAQASRFEFDSREQKLKMYENAILKQGEAIVEGDYLYYDTQTENIGAESKPNTRIKMTIPNKTNN